MMPKTPSRNPTRTLERDPPIAAAHALLQSLLKRLLAADTEPDTLRIRFMAGR